MSVGLIFASLSLPFLFLILFASPKYNMGQKLKRQKKREKERTKNPK